MAKTFQIREQSTARYTAILKDELGNPIPASSLSALTLTLYNLSSALKQIINHRDHQPVLNNHNVTVDENGAVTWSITPNDTPILDDARPFEDHMALWQFSWLGSAKQASHETIFRVENVEKVT